MDFAAVVVIQVVYAIASLALISIGLAIIFGMMRVINFAHRRIPHARRVRYDTAESRRH